MESDVLLINVEEGTKWQPNVGPKNDDEDEWIRFALFFFLQSETYFWCLVLFVFVL